MMTRHVLAVILLSTSLSGFAQVINATLSGTVADSSGALIPGVEITAQNTGTNVASTTITNESGTYRFPSLQPGTYRVSAQLPGFQTQAFELVLGTSQQIRQNFTLQIGAVAQALEVNAAPDELLTTSVQSVSNVLPQRQVMDLPLVGRNVLDFVTTTTAGVIGTGGAATTFAGIRASGSGAVNVQVDGQTVNNGRYEQGISGATNINPDMIDEVRLVVAAVDVEGRGSAQVQVRTRSGTNEFHGGAVWNLRNSVLDANSWSNNRLGLAKTWYNKHQYTASLGGPIRRNQTFFFALFDGQRALQKESVEALVLTPTARQGIFRFFPGVINGNADATPSGSGITRIAPVVDKLGNPLNWTLIPGATGPMQSFNVFGDSLNPGDPLRRGMDPTGFITRLLGDMPSANAYDGPATNGGNAVDGLNTAIHRWTRRTVGGPGGTGSAPDNFNRNQVNIKIDHHFNRDHRLTGSWNRAHSYSDNNELSPWPNGFSGESITDPSVLSLNFTSVLSPAILNEFRFGRTFTTLRWIPSYHNTKHGEEAWNYMPVINDIPVLIHPTLFDLNMLGCSGRCSSIGHNSPLTTYTNTLSWTSGAHALKFGAEVRRANSRGWSNGMIIPHVYGGAGDVPVRGIDTIMGLLPANQTLAQNLLLSLSGSVNEIRQRFEFRSAEASSEFVDFRGTYFHPENRTNEHGKIMDWHQNEFNFFIKDDWKATRNLTLNFGIRYDLMQVPYALDANGQNFTPGLVGGESAAFGYSGRSFADWMSGGGPQKAALTQATLIGKGTPNPNQGLWRSDHNNWAPAVGFAWSPGWWGQDKTTIRGGYQIAYQLPGGSLSWVHVDAAEVPGMLYNPSDFGDGTFRNLSNITIPLQVTQKPLETVPLTQRAQELRTYDVNYSTPYVQTFTLGVTRAVASNLTLDVRYVGTRGVKLHSVFNINSPDFKNNGLFDALQVTRAGGNAAMFDRMMANLNIGSGVIGRDISGSEALRRHASTRTAIAAGNFVAVAQWLNTTNAGTVQPPLTSGGLLRSSGLFPENFIVANPQFSNVMIRRNMDNSTYHSMQTEMTLRPTRGVTYNAAYTWSKSLGVYSTGFTGINSYRDPTNVFADYSLEASNRTHAFRSYGTFELPFGPNKLLGGATSGWVARVIEGWKLGAIANLTSGAPLSVTAQTTLYGTGNPDVVGDFPREGKVGWDSGATFGNYFSQQYQRVRDPQCAGVGSSLTQWCTINALADGNGNIVLQHPGPGRFGTLGLTTIEGPGSWDLDMNLQKTVRIHESKTFTMRIDAQNVFNHPTPGNPNLNVNTGTFGQITSKTGTRRVQALLRFDF